MRTIIVGGGKIGYYLTKNLIEGDRDVSIIEIDKARSRVLANELHAMVIYGNGTSVKALEQAGIKQCGAIIAVTGKDEDNLIVCQLAKGLYKVPKTICKVNNPKNVGAMKNFDIDIVVSAAEDIIKKLENEVSDAALKKLIQLNDGNAALFEVRLPENYALAYKQLWEIQLPEHCNIISLTRDGEFIIPRGKTRLMDNDKLLIVSSTDAMNDVRKALKVKK